VNLIRAFSLVSTPNRLRPLLSQSYNSNQILIKRLINRSDKRPIREF
jgi:hypothetical protein